MPPDDPPHAEQASEKPSLVGRLRNALAAVRGLPAWAKTHRLLAAAVGGGALVAITCVVTLALVLAKDEEEIPPEVLLEQAFAALDAGDRTTAAELAEKLRDAKSLLIDDVSGPPYILGIIAGERADESWGRDKPTLHLLAASLLKESHDHGFPPSREAEGAYQLGRHLYLAGKIAASRSPLKEAIGLQHPRARNPWFAGGSEPSRPDSALEGRLGTQCGVSQAPRAYAGAAAKRLAPARPRAAFAGRSGGLPRNAGAASSRQ